MNQPSPTVLSCAGAFEEVLAEARRLAEAGETITLTGLDALEPAEARQLLTLYLHDPAVQRPIEPFASLLGALVRKVRLGLWAFHPEAPRDTILEALPREQPQCMACPSFPLCQGYAAWAGSCATWLALLTGLAEAARELGRLHRSTFGSCHDEA